MCSLRTATFLAGQRPFTHVIIDEAGQALEPQAYVALANAAPDARVLLCGDPKQLGPRAHDARLSTCARGPGRTRSVKGG